MESFQCGTYTSAQGHHQVVRQQKAPVEQGTGSEVDKWASAAVLDPGQLQHSLMLPKCIMTSVKLDDSQQSAHYTCIVCASLYVAEVEADCIEIPLSINVIECCLKSAVLMWQA